MKHPAESRDPVAPGSPEPGGTLTIRIRRAHLWALAGLVIGGIAGFGIARVTADDPRPILYGLPPDAAGAATAQTPTATGADPSAPSSPVEIDTTDRPAFGPEDAAVTMIEFIDFECPFCGAYASETFPRIEREYGDRIRYVSMQFPLSIHENALPAARAAECAFAQDRYWEYHQELFADQEALGPSDLIDHARHAGLDVATFEDCLKSSEARQRVEADLAAATDAGVSATPTFFINGVPVNGALPYAEFKAALDDALAAADDS